MYFFMCCCTLVHWSLFVWFLKTICSVCWWKPYIFFRIWLPILKYILIIRCIMHRQHPIGKILCNNYRTMVAMILISTIPTGILGYLLQNLVDRWSSSLPVTGLGLLITAVLLLVVDNWQWGISCQSILQFLRLSLRRMSGNQCDSRNFPFRYHYNRRIFMRFSPRFRHSIFLSCIDSGNPGCYDSWMWKTGIKICHLVSWIQLYSRYAHRSCRRIFFHSIYAGFYKEEKTSHFFHLLFYHGDSCDRLLFCVEHIR